jgi:hypothetical protein
MGKNALGLDVEPPVSPKLLLDPRFHHQQRVGSPPLHSRRGPISRAHRIAVVLAVSLLAGTLWLATSADPLTTTYTRPSAAAPAAARGFRILHLIDKETHESVMDRCGWPMSTSLRGQLIPSHRWFQRSDSAFSAHKQVDEAIYWGPGFPGYDANATLVQNVEVRGRLSRVQ